MALIKCYECRAKISTEAASCPHCGAPKKVEQIPSNPGKKKTSPLTWTVLVIIVLFVFIVMSTPTSNTSSSLSPAERKEREEQLVEEVLKVPASDVEKNIHLYKELHNLNPDSPRYRTKLAHYRSKRAEPENALEKAKREAEDPPAMWKLISTPGKAKSVVVEESAMSPGDYEKIIRELCSPNAFCWVDFWSDEKLVPRSGGIDITDRQCQAWIANYANNPSTRYGDFNWDPC